MSRLVPFVISSSAGILLTMYYGHREKFSEPRTPLKAAMFKTFLKSFIIFSNSILLYNKELGGEGQAPLLPTYVKATGMWQIIDIITTQKNSTEACYKRYNNVMLALCFAVDGKYKH